VAITTTVYVTPQPIMEIVESVRQQSKNTTVIVGGPYLADLPKILDEAALAEHLEMLGADIYIFGAEGEETLVKVISALKLGEDYRHIDSIGYNTENGFKINRIVPEGNNLEDNMVDYSLFDKKDIGEFVTVRTAKSCPFACAFCGFPERAGKYKYLPVDYVEKELDAIRDIGGVTTITFIDDTFNVPKGRFKDMLRMMIKNDYQFRWNSYLRSDHVDDEALELMAASGCDGVFLGVESGSTDILVNMAKNSRPEHYRRVIKKCRELGIITYASVIIGFPGEDRRTVQESIDFLNEAKPDFFRAQVWYAGPITPIYKKGQDYDLSGQAFQWRHKTMDSMEAAYYVEKMFLCVTGSTWLPQNGFEPWSLYYLQRKGMTLSKIRSYLEYFNDGLKQKLLSKNSPDVGRVFY
ncbi:radical SAM protein, partial [Pseudomonas cedrina]